MTDSSDKQRNTNSAADTVTARPQVWKPESASASSSGALASPAQPKEIGGREGPEPTRFGDWEKNGRCIDF